MPLFWSEISSSLLTFRFHCLTCIFILYSPKNLTIAWMLIYDVLDPGISLCKTHAFVYRNENLYVTGKCSTTSSSENPSLGTLITYICFEQSCIGMTLFPVCFLAASCLLTLPSTFRSTESITNFTSLKIQAFWASQSALLLQEHALCNCYVDI